MNHAELKREAAELVDRFVVAMPVQIGRRLVEIVNLLCEELDRRPAVRDPVPLQHETGDQSCDRS